MIERDSCFNCKYCSEKPISEKERNDVNGKRILYTYSCKNTFPLYVWNKNELNNMGCSDYEKYVEENNQLNFFNLL